MLYVRFVPLALNQWSVFVPVQSAKPIARVKRRLDGQFVARSTAGHTLSREVVAACLDFIEDRERKQAA
jgi:hypothetical protein